MNRIYQGRVTKVQLCCEPQETKEVGPQKEGKAKKPEWRKMPDGEAALWRHHELFQDAVVVIG